MLLTLSPVPMSPVLLPHSMVLRAPGSKHLSPKSLSSPKAGLLQAPPTPCEQRGQAEKVGGILGPSQAKPRDLGLFPPPLLPAPLGPTLRGKAHGPRCAQGALCRGCRNRPTAVAVGHREALSRRADVWSSD